MWPQPLFNILGWEITPYVLIYVVSVFPALGLALFLGREREIPAALILDGWLITVTAGAVGAFVIPPLLQMLWPAMPSLGSLAGIPLALIAAAFFARWRRGRQGQPGEVLDVLFPALALTYVIGRIGCFAAGCCHGRPVPGLPWAVIFNDPDTASIYRGVPVHPVQLYESLGCLGLCALLLALWRRPAWRGQLVWAYLLSYGSLRFVLEFYRGDVRPMVGPLSLNQVICAVFIVIGAALLVRHFSAALNRLVSASAGRSISCLPTPNEPIS